MPDQLGLDLADFKEHGPDQTRTTKILKISDQYGPTDLVRESLLIRT